MEEITENELSKIWKKEGLKYVNAVNSYNANGIKNNWMISEKEPEITRISIAEQVVDYIRKANKTSNTTNLRKKFPPAHTPFLDILDEKGQHLGPVVFLPDNNSILLRIGAPYESGIVVKIENDSVTEFSDIISFGCSPDKKFLAIVKKSGIEIKNTFNGKTITNLKLPTRLEDLPEKLNPPQLDTIIVTSIIPFPDGKRTLFISPHGIYVLTPQKNIRVYPNKQILQEWLDEGNLKNDESISHIIDMEHGAISPDGKFFAIGCQDSTHLIFNDNYELVGNVQNESSYPHFAIFSSDSSIVALNSCHFYNGITIGVDTSLLPLPINKEYISENTLEESSRVYAGIYRKDEFIVGDAYGYLTAFDKSGSFKWMHYIGSTITSIDITSDETKLVVGSCAGFLCIINLNTGQKDPFTITTSTHIEEKRWIFWKGEETPLMW